MDHKIRCLAIIACWVFFFFFFFAAPSLSRLCLLSTGGFGILSARRGCCHLGRGHLGPPHPKERSHSPGRAGMQIWGQNYPSMDHKSHPGCSKPSSDTSRGSKHPNPKGILGRSCAQQIPELNGIPCSGAPGCSCLAVNLSVLDYPLQVQINSLCFPNPLDSGLDNEQGQLPGSESRIIYKAALFLGLKKKN